MSHSTSALANRLTVRRRAPGRLQGQVTPGLLDQIFGLVVAQMVWTP